jgi:hypothetical protein
MRQKVEDFINPLKEAEQEYEITFVKHLNQHSRNPDNTVLEARFKNEKQASSIRANFIKKKDHADFSSYNVTPAVRLATRVRIEIIQAVARVLKRTDSTVSKTQCLQFVPKPTLKVFRKDNGGNESSRVMSFVDCILWVLENELEKSVDLSKASQRAGSNFRSTMAQHFVIMSNS